jgi:hypothetical protein
VNFHVVLSRPFQHRHDIAGARANGCGDAAERCRNKGTAPLTDKKFLVVSDLVFLIWLRYLAQALAPYVLPSRM